MKLCWCSRKYDGKLEKYFDKSIVPTLLHMAVKQANNRRGGNLSQKVGIIKSMSFRITSRWAKSHKGYAFVRSFDSLHKWLRANQGSVSTSVSATLDKHLKGKIRQYPPEQMMSRTSVVFEVHTSWSSAWRAPLFCTQCSVGSWAFYWGHNCVESSDWSWSRRLSFRNSCAGQMVFVLVWPQTKYK